MKLLAFGLMATLVAVALPVNAEVGNVGKPDRTERIDGAQCFTQITEKGQKPADARCHHVVKTSGGNSLNFHFDSEKEDEGITYVVNNKIEQDSQGRTYYQLLGLVVRTDGKASKPIEASGICTTDNKELTRLAVACVAELKDGTKLQSMLIK
jgi:hypothetical protein